MATMSVSGVVSGMDWDSMIDELITKAAKPAQVQVAKRSNLTNKKSLFEEMKVTMNSLQSSLTSLKLPSTYKAKEVDIERIDTNGSYKGVLTATVNADAEVNVYDLKVNKLARAQTNRSKQITASSVGSALSDQGISSGTMYINMAGQKVGIDISSTDSLQSIKSKINNTLKTQDIPVEVTASVVDNRLILRSDNTGLGANSLTETLTYNLNGKNTITSFNVNDADLKNGNFVIRDSKSNKLSYGTDYDVVNGNEIRWNQYKATDNVKLGKSVTAQYKIAKGDLYESSGTYGKTEAKVSGISVKDNGTLSSRLRIEDEDGNTYTYGKDFTLDSSGNVVWLEEEESNTNEPDKYTVSYSKTTTETYSVTGEKVSPVRAPSKYTVSYEGNVLSLSAGQLTVTGNTNAASIGSYTLTSFTATEGVKSTTKLSSDGTAKYIDFEEGYEPVLEINGTTYEYGKDYIIRSSSTTTSNGVFIINAEDRYYNYTSGTSYTYVSDYQGSPSTTSDSTAQNPIDNIASATFSLKKDVSFTQDDATQISNLLNDSDTKTSKIVIKGADGETLTEGTDYSIETDSSGKKYIAWYTVEEPIDVSKTQFEELQTKYAEAYALAHDGESTTLSTVTLIDGDGVLRTYVDPEDPGIFNMSAGSENGYVYGRDYVLRVNDSGTGYRFQWLVEDSDTITDASTVVATYAAYKNISTSEWKEAPKNGINYKFGFSYDLTTTDSGTVNASDSDDDKLLTKIIKNVTVDSSDYSTALTISDGTNTYTYGTDWTIDAGGKITWLEKGTGTPTSYTATYTNPSVTITTAANSYNLTTAANGFPKYSDFEALYKTTTGNDVPTVTAGGLTYIADESFFNVSGYTYGEDFVVIKGGGGAYSTVGDYSLVVVWAPDNIVKNYPNKTMSSITSHTAPYTVAMQSVTSDPVSTDSGKKLSDVLGLTDLSDMSKVTITAGGRDYTYNSSAATANDLAEDEYFLDNGVVVLGITSEPTSHPEEGKAYTLIYDPFTSIALGTFDGEETQQAVFIVDDGDGNIEGNQLSYEQILSDTGLTSSSTDTEFAQYFSLVDEDGTEYEYGVDYRIVKGSTADSDSGEYTPMIEWIMTGYQPVPGTNFTLNYLGRSDTIDFDVERSYTDAIQAGTSGTSPLYSYFDGGTTTITQGSKTFYEGIDYEIVKSTTTNEYGDTITNAAVEWKTGTNSEWYYPTSNASYTINLTTSTGNSLSFSAVRTPLDTLDLRDYGFTSVNGSITGVTYDSKFWDLTTPAETTTNDDGTTTTNPSGKDKAKNTLGLDVTDGTNGGFNVFNFNWVDPERTANPNLPGINEEFKVEYTYNANTFTLSDDSDGKLLAAFELDQTDSEHYMAAQNAELELDGETITRDSNDIGESYDNELIKGMTIHLKGVGEVSLDVAHDAQKAVESIQTFVDTYNDLMSWMNTRMTEKQVDKDTEATIDSDDFRMRWGLLHGNSLLRQTKSTMRSLISQNFTFSFTQRGSASEIYGNMARNGLRNDATLRLRINSKYVDVSILPTDTLQDIVDKINDDSEDGPMHDIYYDDEGKKLDQPLLKASIENDRLVINSTNNDSITMSGTSAMNALKMNYTYKGLYQIGISTTSTDYGKSGELEFDANEFMEALEDNPNEVQELMLMFANEFDTWTKSMLNSSASGETSGTLTRQIEDLENQISTIDEYLEKYQDRLDKQEEQLQKKYASTETSLAKLSQQANSIAAILNQLNGYTNNNSSSS